MQKIIFKSCNSQYIDIRPYVFAFINSFREYLYIVKSVLEEQV